VQELQASRFSMCLTCRHPACLQHSNSTNTLGTGAMTPENGSGSPIWGAKWTEDDGSVLDVAGNTGSPMISIPISLPEIGSPPPGEGAHCSEEGHAVPARLISAESLESLEYIDSVSVVGAGDMSPGRHRQPVLICMLLCIGTQVKCMYCIFALYILLCVICVYMYSCHI
jgi:hypothetical protein